MKQLILKTIYMNMNKKIIRSHQNGFTKGKPCSDKLPAFHSEVTGLVDEERTDIAYLDYSEAFTTVSHKILTQKLMKYGLDKQTVRWTENG